MKKKKDKRGGAGRGQGRKELPYKSKVLKVPEPLIPYFKKQIAEFKKSLISV